MSQLHTLLLALQRFIIEDAMSRVLASGFPQEAKRFSDAPRTCLRTPQSPRPSGRRYKTATKSRFCARRLPQTVPRNYIFAAVQSHKSCSKDWKHSIPHHQARDLRGES